VDLGYRPFFFTFAFFFGIAGFFEDLAVFFGDSCFSTFGGLEAFATSAFATDGGTGTIAGAPFPFFLLETGATTAAA
jgi:hypothetical protein